MLEVAEEPWRTLYLLAIHSGLRRGEILGLHRDDLDARSRLLWVRRSLGRVKEDGRYIVREKALKTRGSRRKLDLAPKAVQALLALPAGDEGLEYPSAPAQVARSIRTTWTGLSGDT